VVGARLLTRRHLEVALGLLWLLDGALQFQPYMFSRAFFDNVLGMAEMFVPQPMAVVTHDLAVLVSSHLVAFNAVFATTQVAIGVGLIWSRTAPAARLASIVWALGVWSVGEGFGNLFMPGMNLLAGAPGAVILYAVVALVIWPRRADGEAVADGGLLGPRAAHVAWAVLWVGTSLLELEVATYAPDALSAQITELAHGEPAIIADMDRHLAHLVLGHGTELALAMMMAQVLIGSWVLRAATRRLALGAGIAVAVIYWVIGQNFGGILTGHGTDPNTAPLLVLLALTLWPRASTRPTSSGTPVWTSFSGQGGARNASSDGPIRSASEVAVTQHRDEQAHLASPAAGHDERDEAETDTGGIEEPTQASRGCRRRSFERSQPLEHGVGGREARKGRDRLDHLDP
jgi:hypothetical protein